MTIGRVTNNILYLSTLRDIKNNNHDLLDLQKKLTTGKEINNLSDNPLGVNRVLDYDLTISQNNQYLKNLDTGTTDLGISDNSLNSLHDLILRAKTLTLSSINSTSTQDTRDAVAVEVSQILKQMVAIANVQNGESFLFAGSNSTNKPFQLIGDEVVYTGDDGDRSSSVSRNTTTPINIPGSRAFGIFQNQTESSHALTPSLQEKIFFESEISSGNIPEGFTFALKDTPTQDIVGKELIITSGPNDSISARVLDYDSATNAVKIETKNFPVSLLSGTTLAIVQAPTKISELNGGKGLPMGNFYGNVGAKSITVDLSKAMNISDIKEIIETSFEGAVKVGFTADGQGLTLQNLSEETIIIKEDGRNTVARELGLLSVGVSKEIAVGSTLVGSKITPALNLNTTIASLNGGAGINSLGFRIKNGTREHVFDTNEIESLSTIGDWINMINTTDLAVEATINENADGLVIRSRSSGDGLAIDDVMSTNTILETVSENQIKLDGTLYLSEPENFIGTQVIITNQDGTTQTREITGFDGSILTLDAAGDFSVGSKLEIYSSRRFLGGVESSTLNSITSAGAFNNAANILPGGTLRITEGKNAGAEFKITGGNNDTVFFINPNNLELDDTSTYEILTGSASSLGINSFSSTGTAVESLLDAQNLTLGKFEITYGAEQIKTIVDVSKANNLQDIIDAIGSATNNQVIATLANGNSLRLEDSRTSSILNHSISITEVDNGTTAKDLGLLDVDGTAGQEYVGTDLKPRNKGTNIFTALFDLIKGLRSDDYLQLNRAGLEIDASLDIILHGRAEIGTRLSNFDLSKNRLEDQNLFLTGLRSNTMDADYIDTVFQFNNKTSVVEASLKAVGSILKTSLLDYL